MQDKLPDKNQVMNLLLTEAVSVFVHLDPRRDRVVVPPHFLKQSMLVLEIGLNMRIPIPDLEIDDEGIGCTLSFGGRPFWCRLPWPSIFALVSNEQKGMVWPADVPSELADRFIPPAPQAPQAPQAQKPKAGLRLVSSKTTEEEPEGNVSNLTPLPAKKSESLPPAPDADGNAAAVLEPPDPPDPQDEPPKKRGSHLRVVK